MGTREGGGRAPGTSLAAAVRGPRTGAGRSGKRPALSRDQCCLCCVMGPPNPQLAAGTGQQHAALLPLPTCDGPGGSTLPPNRDEVATVPLLGAGPTARRDAEVPGGTQLRALWDFGCPPAALSSQALPLGMWPALVLWAWLVLGTAGGESPAPTALAGGQPFAVLWNIPSSRCQRRFGVGLPLADYGIVENRGGRFAGQNITIFYKNKFGLYPYISPQGVPHNGGIPQRAPLRAHLARVAGDVRLHLRPAFSGLAVVDWEEWRPLWARNWGRKRVYQLASQRWAQERGRGRRLARRAFERAARALMEQTLLLGRSLRPAGLWGFYRFPDCFNDDWAKVANYTGRCRPAEVQRNDRLRWLWAASAALYPSIYLPPLLPPGLRRRYVHHRLCEALRLAAGRLPVVAYSRLSYRRSPRFLEPVRARGGARCPGVSPRPHGSLSLQADLEHTIGESAALGAAGVVLWGDMSYSRSAVSMATTAPPEPDTNRLGRCLGVPLRAAPHGCLPPRRAAAAFATTSCPSWGPTWPT